MKRYRMNEVERGLKFLMKGEPCIATDVDFNKPGKGQVHVRIDYRNLKTGRNAVYVMAGKDTLEAADIVETAMTCERRNRTHWHFHDPETGERCAADANALRDAAAWIKGGETCVVTRWNGDPIHVAAPAFVELVVKETDPGLRGNTAGAATKPATLETGVVVRVPLFVTEGEIVRIDTRSREYADRAR